jgi:hypothetical protein
VLTGTGQQASARLMYQATIDVSSIRIWLRDPVS